MVDAMTSSQPQPAEKSSEKAGDEKQRMKDFVAKQKKELAAIHPGFLSARSVVLHHFSTNEKYEPWRMQMLGLGNFFNVDANVEAKGDSPTADNANQPAAVGKIG